MYKLGDRHDELNISFSDNSQYRFSQMINYRDKLISIVIVDTSAIQYVYQLDLFDLFLKLYSQRNRYKFSTILRYTQDVVESAVSLLSYNQEMDWECQ